MVEELTYEEKIETILSILATPIWRRRLGDNELNKLITEAYFEMKEQNTNDLKINLKENKYEPH